MPIAAHFEAFTVDGRYLPRSTSNQARGRFIRDRKRRLLDSVPTRPLTEVQSRLIQQLVQSEWDLHVLRLEQDRIRRAVLDHDTVVMRLGRELDHTIRANQPPAPPPSPGEAIAALKRSVIAERDERRRKRTGT